MSFEDDERKPGEKTNLILKATPGSRVAFVAVDKSLLFLKTGNELTTEKVCAEYDARTTKQQVDHSHYAGSGNISMSHIVCCILTFVNQIHTSTL